MVDNSIADRLGAIAFMKVILVSPGAGDVAGVQLEDKFSLVCDQLNTHSMASLYETFPAEEAHRLARKLEIVRTPKRHSVTG